MAIEFWYKGESDLETFCERIQNNMGDVTGVTIIKNETKMASPQEVTAEATVVAVTYTPNSGNRILFSEDDPERYNRG